MGFTYPRTEGVQRFAQVAELALAEAAALTPTIAEVLTSVVQATAEDVDPVDLAAEHTRLFSEDVACSPYETEYETDTGAVRVPDFMTPRRGQARVVRLVEGLRGVVPKHLELNLRFDYGIAVPWLRPGRRSVTAVAGPDAVELRTDVPLDVVTGLVTADMMIKAGERASFALVWHR